jgi:hypothetical protein
MRSGNELPFRILSGFWPEQAGQAQKYRATDKLGGRPYLVKFPKG